MIRTSVMAGVVAVALATFAAPAGAWERDGFRGEMRQHHVERSYGADRGQRYARPQRYEYPHRYERHGRYDGPPPWRRRWAHWHRSPGWGYARHW